MKSLYLSLFALFITAVSHAQNVGIGTSTPANLLTVHGLGQSVSAESPDNNTKIGFYVADGFPYLQTHSNHDLLFATNNGSAQMTLQKTTGNLGIGTPNPTARLDVNGTFKLTNGTEAAGRVLTSDGAGNASWQNAPYGNTERFAVKLKGSQAAPTQLTTLYNTGSALALSMRSNTATQQMATLNIGIARGGLYHLSFAISSRDNSNIGNGSRLSAALSYTVGATTTELFTKNLPLYNGGVGWNGSYDNELELVIPGGTTLSLSLIVPASLQDFWSLDALVTGHLIAD